MNEFLMKQIITAISLSLFYSAYALFMKRETFFKVNRFVILFMLIFSFSTPFITIPTSNKQVEYVQSNEIIKPVRSVLLETSKTEANKPVIVQTKVNSEANYTKNDINWLLIIYWFGFSFFAIKTLYGIIKIYTIKSISKYNIDGYYELPGNISSFSFFKNIFINSNLKLNEKLQVLEHERVHANQLHSVDTILFNIAKCFQWFNPFVYLMEKELKEVHEYLADSAFKINSKIEYMELLLNQTLSAQQVELANNFNSSTIFKRIKMLDGNESKKIKALKYALALIPLAMCLVLFACKQEEFKPTPAKITIPFADKNKHIPESLFLIDKPQVPVNGWLAFNNWLDKEIQTPNEAKTNNKAGIVNISFIIDSTGSMTNLEYWGTQTIEVKNGKRVVKEFDKGMGYGIEDEAIRVVKKLAEQVKWRPASYKGRPVSYYGSINITVGDKALVKGAENSMGYINYCDSDKLGYFTLIKCDNAPRITAEPPVIKEKHIKFIEDEIYSQKDLFTQKDSGEVVISFNIDANGNSKEVRIENKNDTKFAGAVRNAVEKLVDMKSEAVIPNQNRTTITIKYLAGVPRTLEKNNYIPGFLHGESCPTIMPKAN